MLISMCYVVHIASSFVKWELAKILSANEINLSTYLLEYCEISNYPLLTVTCKKTDSCVNHKKFTKYAAAFWKHKTISQKLEFDAEVCFGLKFF